MPADLTHRERFANVMEYRPVDRVPNWEVGVWPQTIERWAREGLDVGSLQWDWFVGDPHWGHDPREYVDLNLRMIPTFEHRMLEETEEHEVFQDAFGIVHKALKAGTVGGGRMCMDQYLRHPVESMDDWVEVKKRFDPASEGRHRPDWREHIERWRARDHVLIPGRNCSTLGFYWCARELMGTENLSMAWYLQPDLMRDMMEHFADFMIEVLRPLLSEGIEFEYIFINEDMAMKTGPLLSPELYIEYIQPNMRRVVEFAKSHGVKYCVVDSDGNTEPLLKPLLDAGVDGIWPMERASEDQDPIELRRKYGRDLRLWGGVDKRELTKGRAAIDAHLRTLIPLIEEGGFIPTVDHTVPPDVSYEHFAYYNERKQDLLAGRM